jgi:hypothetical protein
MNNKLRNAIVNNEYGRKPYVSDNDYQTFMEETPFKAVADQYKAAGVSYPESEFQPPYTDDTEGEDYQGVENNWQPPAFNLPDIPQFSVGIPDIVSGCKALWDKLVKNAGTNESRLREAMLEYSKYCPGEFLAKQCCVGMSIVGPDTVDSGSTAEYKMVGLNFACNYEAAAKLGEITGSLSSFGTETYTAPAVSTTTTDIIKVTHWFTGKICATKKITIHPAGCDGETISYTTQMNVGTSQTLAVVGAVLGKTYTWTVSVGTLSSPTGTSVTYTAPAANANCSANCAVSLKVGSSTCDSKTIYINAVTSTDIAYWTWVRTTCSPFGGGYVCYGDEYAYSCEGTLLQHKVGYGTFGSSCVACYATLEAFPIATSSTPRTAGIADVRTVSMKTNGCCPSALV